MRQIVITGATSFIGVRLIQEWLKENCEIFAVVRGGCQKLHLLPENNQIRIIEADMDQYDNLPSKIEKADFFYHLAWEGTRGDSRNDESMQLRNYECSLKAFHAASAIGCSFFLGSGSQAEYGKMCGSVSEEDECHPTTAYGKQKLNTCRALETLAAQNGMRFVWTRIFSLYGENDFAGTLVSSCIDKMLHNEPIELTACTQLWDYLYVEDAAYAMKYLALQNCAGGIYNVASGEYKPLKEYVTEMQSVTGSSGELLFGAVPYGSGGAVDLIPDIDKLLKTGWKPRTSFSDGIRSIVLERKKNL